MKYALSLSVILVHGHNVQIKSRSIYDVLTNNKLSQ